MYTPSGYNASSLFNLMTGSSLNGELSIVFSDGVTSCTLTGDDAMSVSITSSLTDDQTYGIGNFSSKQATIVLLSDSLNRVVNAIGKYTGISITISFQITTNVLIPMGVFYANPSDVISTEGVSCTLTAYDSAYYMSGSYVPTITTWPVTPATLINDIITQHGGITLASDAYSGLNSSLLATAFCIDPTISSQYYTDSIENYTNTFTGDGNTTTFTLTHEPSEVISCTVGGVETEDYYIDETSLVFDEAPANGDAIRFVYKYIYSGNLTYDHEAITYRQAIAHVAFLMGCNAVFDRSDKLKFIPFVPNSSSRTSLMTITPAYYAPLTFSKASNTKSYLGVLDAQYTYLDENGQQQTGENIYVSESEYSNTFTIDTFDISNASIANKFGVATLGVTGIDYQGYDLSMLYGFPYLDCGDAFTVIDYSNVTYDGLPIFSVTHTYDGTFTTSMRAGALADENIQVSYNASYKSKMDASALNAASANANAIAAQIASETAQRHADTAYIEAQNAHAAAQEAEDHAMHANVYANSALDQLSVVEDVIGVLTWASEHGTFTLTQDQTIQEGKVYFTYDSQTGDYTPVVDPQESALSTYYELSVNEAMESFIMAHLAVTARGLWVLPSGYGTATDAQYAPGYKALLSNSGLVIYDGSGVAVSTFGQNISFSDARIQYIGNDNAYIIFNPDNGGSITIGGTAILGGDSVPLSERMSDLQSEIDHTLIYDHEYTVTNGTAFFTAYLYKSGVDVKTDYDADQFTWFYKTEASQTLTSLGTGYTCSVNLSAMGYGGHVIGHFIESDDAELLTRNDDYLADSSNNRMTARTASGETVRVSDLTVATTLYPTDKLMVVGSGDEHLVSIATLQDYLNANLEKQVKFNTTAGWNAQTTLVSDANTLYIYTDHRTDAGGRNVAGIKAGDGLAYVVDLPFTDAVATEHISNSTIHITASERSYWNNKVRCYYGGTENLIFTTLA